MMATLIGRERDWTDAVLYAAKRLRWRCCLVGSVLTVGVRARRQELQMYELLPWLNRLDEGRIGVLWIGEDHGMRAF